MFNFENASPSSVEACEKSGDEFSEEEMLLMIFSTKTKENYVIYQ